MNGLRERSASPSHLGFELAIYGNYVGEIRQINLLAGRFVKNGTDRVLTIVRRAGMFVAATPSILTS
jgi:hypothetical protein